MDDFRHKDPETRSNNLSYIIKRPPASWSYRAVVFCLQHRTFTQFILPESFSPPLWFVFIRVTRLKALDKFRRPRKTTEGATVSLIFWFGRIPVFNHSWL